MRGTTTKLAGLASVLAVFAACESSTAPEDISPSYAICGSSGDCGPEPRDPPGDTGTTAPVEAKFNYYSLVSTYYTGSLSTKHADLLSVSRAISAVSYTSVTANMYYTPNCSGTQSFLATRTHSGGGVGTFSAGSFQQYSSGLRIAWKVLGSHSFTPSAGAVGGGNFSSSASVCF